VIANNVSPHKIKRATEIARADPPPPLVSVVIPSYNCRTVIGETLESVLAQDYPAVEIIVVDDGSTDGTCDVVARYGGRVTLVRQRNAGAAVARNEGIRRALGKYVALLDADDLWLPTKLSLQIEYLEQHPEVGMCCTHWHLGCWGRAPEFDTSTATSPPARLDQNWSGWIYTKLLQNCVVWTSTVVMRRELANRVGDFEPELRRGQDYDYWLRASRLTEIHTLDAPLAIYRLDEAAQGRKHPDKNWELTVISNALERWGATGPDGQALTRAQVRTRLWELNFVFGHINFHRGRYMIAWTAFVAALCQKPMHLKTMLYLIVTSVRQVGALAGIASGRTKP